MGSTLFLNRTVKALVFIAASLLGCLVGLVSAYFVFSAPKPTYGAVSTSSRFVELTNTRMNGVTYIVVEDKQTGVEYVDVEGAGTSFRPLLNPNGTLLVASK